MHRFFPALVPAALVAIAASDVAAQPRMRPPIPIGAVGDAAGGGGGGPAPATTGTTQGVQPVAPPGGAAAPGAAGAPGAPAGPAGAAGAAKPGAPNTPGGRARGDTSGLQQFEQGVEFEPRGPNYRVSFSLEDADLPELVRVIGQLTGKRFIFGGKVRNIKATVFSPQKVTVAEAYQAFLSILETNGLTVIPHGRFLKIIETPNASAQGTPVYGAGQGATTEDRYITRIHRLGHVSADEAAAVLGHFKSKDGDITVYGPGNLLIITDTGTNIRRMLQIVEDIDVGGIGDQIWIEPVHYTAASDVANRLNEVFELKGGGGGGAAAGAKPGGAPGAPATGHAGAGGGDLHIAKILPDDRSNSLVIVATERAYLRVLEFIKRIDVPHSGEGEIHVLPLQHADAIDLAKTLNEIITGATQAGGAAGGAAPKPGGAMPLTGVFESGVKVSADKATNSLVITSSLRDYAALRVVIDRLDQPRRQVFIEAVIMDLTITRQNQLGMAFHAGDVETSPVGSGQSLIYGGLNPIRTIGLPPLTDGTLNAFALGVRGPGLPGSDNLLGTGFSIPAFGILLNALAGSNDADILSTPHILALDNEKAEISVGQNIAIQQNAPGLSGLAGLGGAAGGAAAGGLGALGGLGGFGFSAPRQDIGTKISITPHINDSNEVRMQVTEEISDVIGDQPQGTLGTIPFAKRTANTFLVVKDQQTVVIGGLVRNRVVRAQTKIPLLGDIPVLGALFRSSSDKMEKSNLILILTPHIVRDQNDLRVIFERKMQERQEFLDHYFVFTDQPDYQPPRDYSRASGLLEDIRQGYFSVDERKRLDELTRPKSPRTHDPGQPLEMPAIGRPAGPAGAGAAPAAPPGANPGAPPAPPNLNVAPPVRNIDKVER